MPGEKARVTKQMVDSIQDSARQETTILNQKIQEEFKTKMTQYQEETDQKLAQKLEVIQKKYQDKLEQQEKDINWEIHSQLLKEKEKLWDAFEHEVYQKLIAYTQSQDYQEWLKELQNKYPQATFMIRTEDKELFSEYPHEIIEIKIGGLYVQEGNNVYDYTLDSRFEKEINAYKTSARIEVE